MPIQFLARSAKLTDVITVEEAEGLLQWILAHPKGKLDLARCTHVHTAALQVLLALRPPVSSLPEDASLAAWLAPALNHQ